MKKNEKMTWEHFVFKRVDVFLTKYRHESYLFLENERFWQNMDMRAVIFSWEIGKKGHPIDFFWPIIEFSFDRIYVFLTNHVHESREFFMKNLTKLYKSTVLLRNRTFFWQNVAMRVVIFSWKIGKKRASYWLFWPIL